MKTVLTVLLSTIALTAGAQNLKGKMEVFNSKNCKLHVYMSPEAMGDVSTIIEGDNELVILEQPSFKSSIKEFNRYVEGLGKPVVKVIADYHTGGLAEYPNDLIVMIEGMPEFEKGEIYGGMLKNFAEIFGGAMDLREHGTGVTVPASSSRTWADVEFVFSPGAQSDFPASSILIDGSVYYMHYAPAKVHLSKLQIPDRNAIDAVREELKKAKATGCKVFIGSHGKPAGIEEVEFQINYLDVMKSLLGKCDDAANFAEELKAAYPSIPGEEAVDAVAQALYR